MTIMLDEMEGRVEIDTLWGSPHHCPRCVWPYLRADATGRSTVWTCDSCGHHWRLDHGELRPLQAIGR